MANRICRAGEIAYDEKKWAFKVQIEKRSETNENIRKDYFFAAKSELDLEVGYSEEYKYYKKYYSTLSVKCETHNYFQLLYRILRKYAQRILIGSITFSPVYREFLIGSI